MEQGIRFLQGYYIFMLVYGLAWRLWIKEPFNDYDDQNRITPASFHRYPYRITIRS